jgi:hypothetical protein
MRATTDHIAPYLTALIVLMLAASVACAQTTRPNLVGYTPDGTAPGPPQTLPDLIAFQSDRSGNMDIWTMLADGTILEQITTHAGYDGAPALSPDGTKIAFHSDRWGVDGSFDIFVIDLPTRALYLMTTCVCDEVTPCWSPDGSRIAYCSDYGPTGAFEVRVVDVSDLAAPGIPTKLTNYNPREYDLEGEAAPSWGANGYITYAAQRGHPGLWSIWATDPDTRDTHEVVGHVGAAGGQDPAWSPDAAQIAYVNMQSGTPSSHNEDIYLAPADGVLPNLGYALTQDSVIGSTGTADQDACWSPSGPNIYFSRHSHDTGQADIFVVSNGDGSAANLTNRPDGFDAYPSAISYSTFWDVPSGHWAYFEIEACQRAGIVSGYGDATYQPDRAVNRDQMAVYISPAVADGDENVPEFTDTPSFPDVDEAHWALDYIEYAVSQNVVAGYGDGTYHPEYEVTRDQMAVYVARSLVAPEGEAGLADYIPADPRNFPDVASDFWSYRHVEYCVENGVVAGYLDGYYHPEYAVTRDQMAVYVARAFGLVS